MTNSDWAIPDNCEFLISKDDIVQVITSNDPADGLFKAYAIKCNEDSREVVLVSEPCNNAQKAVESLHTKSCQAIHNYITTNGFSAPRDLKSALLELNLDDDDAASVISGHSDSSTAALSEWGSSGDEATVLHHASALNLNEAPKDRQRPAGRPGSQATTTASAHEPLVVSGSRAAARGSPEYTNPAPPRARAVRPARSRSPSFFRQAPPPPPPGHPAHPKSDGPPAPPPPSMRGIPVPPLPHSYAAKVGGMGPSPQQYGRLLSAPPPMHPIAPVQPFTCYRLPGIPINRAPPFPASYEGNRPPIAFHPSGPHATSINSSSVKQPPRPLSIYRPATRRHTVGLTIHWVGHGQHRIITQLLPTLQALQEAAITAVRLTPEGFTGEDPSMREAAGPKNRDDTRPDLVAHVRKGVVGTETYDMRGFHGQDLAGLFENMSAHGMPTFEVVVRHSPLTDDDDDDDEDATGWDYTN